MGVDGDFSLEISELLSPFGNKKPHLSSDQEKPILIEIFKKSL